VSQEVVGNKYSSTLITTRYEKHSKTLVRLLSDVTIMDGLSATPHNNSVHYYCVRDNGHGERRFLCLRHCCLRTPIGLGRLPEEVLLKESGVSHRGDRRQSILGASIVLRERERVWKVDAHACVENF
jgi:hypothetical protein